MSRRRKKRAAGEPIFSTSHFKIAGRVAWVVGWAVRDPVVPIQFNGVELFDGGLARPAEEAKAAALAIAPKATRIMFRGKAQEYVRRMPLGEDVDETVSGLFAGLGIPCSAEVQ
jgi:hypothetical protein